VGIEPTPRPALAFRRSAVIVALSVSLSRNTYY